MKSKHCWRLIFSAAVAVLFLVLIVGCKKGTEEKAPPPAEVPGQMGEEIPLESMPPEGIAPVARPERHVVVPPEVTERWEGVHLLVREKTEGGTAMEYDVPVNGQVLAEGTGLTINVGDLLPDFSMDASVLTSRSADPNMPAVWLEVIEGGEKIFEGWVFAKMPDVHAFTHEKYQIVFQALVAR